jgi:hypothetical protein
MNRDSLIKYIENNSSIDVIEFSDTINKCKNDSIIYNCCIDIIYKKQNRHKYMINNINYIIKSELSL